MTAWLMKKKSGTSLVRVREYNKRFFTLDFESRVLFYAQKADSKKVSSVIPFIDIVDVSSTSDVSKQASDTTSNSSKRSNTSILRRLSSRLQGVDEEPEHMVIIVLRSAKRLELVCPTAGIATRWYQAVRTAIANARSTAARGPAAGGYPALAPAAVPKASALPPRLPPSANGAAGPSANGYAAAAAPVVAVAAPPLAAAAKEKGKEGDAEEDDDAAGPVIAPPSKGNFLDFSSMDEAKADEVQPGSKNQDGDTAGQQDSVVIETPAILQASDFGFGDDDASETSSEASNVHLPAVGTAPAGDATKAAAPSTAAGPGAAAGASAPAADGVAEDKHVGLSMQQRLQAIEFSDDEEDDDDPLGANVKSADADIDHRPV
jgi:hypothetical protein